MSSDHDGRRAHEDNRNEHHLRVAQNGTRGYGALDDYFGRVRRELHLLMQQEPALAFAGPDVLFARLTTPETAPDYASCLRRAAFAFLLVRAQDRAETASPTTGDAA